MYQIIDDCTCLACSLVGPLSLNIYPEQIPGYFCRIERVKSYFTAILNKLSQIINAIAQNLNN